MIFSQSLKNDNISFFFKSVMAKVKMFYTVKVRQVKWEMALYLLRGGVNRFTSL